MTPRDGYQNGYGDSGRRGNGEGRRSGGKGRRWDARKGQFVDVAYSDSKGRPNRRHHSDSDGEGNSEGGQHGRRGNGRGKGGNRTFNKKHNQQRGGDRGGHRNSQGKRPGFRDERLAVHSNEPDLPDDINVRDLDSSVRQDLRSLSKDNADAVAKHMIMAATWMADDPKLALSHARAAKNRAGRVSVVRETNGIAAYHAGEWKEALSELRAARRMSGGPGLIAVMADSERGLGRPEKALELAREEDLSELNRADSIELAIVLAGARQDLEQFDAAITELTKLDPDPQANDPESARLDYALGNAYELADDKEKAREWFEIARRADVDELLDAEDRLKELG